MTEVAWSNPDGLLVRPETPCGTGVLVLAGSSGRIDSGRARLLGSHGALALSIRWFGGPEQPNGPCEIALETFSAALDSLAPECDRLAIVGTSFGAEAALLMGTIDRRPGCVAAFAPTPVVWAGVREGDTVTSHWSLAGYPLPYLPFVEPEGSLGDPPAFRELYAASLAAAPPERRAAATIPVEQIRGDLILVAGGDDQVWPSLDWVPHIVHRRATSGLATVVLSHPAAGHRTVLPGEPAVRTGAQLSRGGSPEADAELGARAWPVLAAALHLRTR